MSGYLNMGGYAAFVWPAYIIVAAVLAALWIASTRALKARETELERAEAANPRRTRP
jgi:heme exporter protein D